MPTVAVLAEQLIAGSQSLVWLYLLMALFLGADWFDFGVLERGGASAGLGLGAAAYTLGVVMDRISDSAAVNLGTWGGDALAYLRTKYASLRGAKPAAKPASAPDSEDFGMMRVATLAAGGELAAYLSYMRSRMRVARATVFNGALAAALLVAHAARPPARPLDPDLMMVGLALGLLVVAAAGWAHSRISITYDKRLLQAYQELRSARSRQSRPQSDALD